MFPLTPEQWEVPEPFLNSGLRVRFLFLLCQDPTGKTHVRFLEEENRLFHLGLSGDQLPEDARPILNIEHG